MAVSSPFLGPAFPVPAARVMLARAASLTTPAVRFESGLLPEWVSRDAGVVAAYAADPHVFSTTTPRWYTEVTAAQRDLLAHAGEITTPALFLVAGSDRIADHRLSLQLFERLGTPALAETTPRVPRAVSRDLQRDRGRPGRGHRRSAGVARLHVGPFTARCGFIWRYA
jgi:alpha-beta hydrolase superfamily lysophospholipase